MNKITAIAVLALFLGTMSAAQADSITKKSADAGIVATIVSDSAGQEELRTCAVLYGTTYCRDGLGDNWVPFDGTTIPVADRHVFVPGQPFDFRVTNIDVSALVGMDVLVCAGTDQADCIREGHYALIYTVPEPTPTPTILHYTERVIALWTASYPYAVTKTGVTKMANKTQYTAGFYPLGNCWIAERPQADGKIPLNCQDAMSLNRHLLYIDPVAEEVHEVAGGSVLPWDTTPMGNGVCGWCKILDYPAGVTWQDVPLPESWVAHPTWYAIARVADGWYFTYSTTAAVLNFQANTGTVTVVTPTATPENNGTFGYIGVYNN
ncbi:MAG: hypothetical protein NUV60_00800 [Patescibacteria group bacterium]|nr:hypothetical protein [Patescibacteria group bacterium]